MRARAQCGGIDPRLTARPSRVSPLSPSRRVCVGPRRRSHPLPSCLAPPPTQCRTTAPSMSTWPESPSSECRRPSSLPRETARQRSVRATRPWPPSSLDPIPLSLAPKQRRARAQHCSRKEARTRPVTSHARVVDTDAATSSVAPGLCVVGGQRLAHAAREMASLALRNLSRRVSDAQSKHRNATSMPIHSRGTRVLTLFLPLSLSRAERYDEVSLPLSSIARVTSH